jgi:L-fuconolactonase
LAVKPDFYQVDTTTMIAKIDAHQHCWKYNPVTYSWIDASMAVIQRDFFPENLVPSLEKNGVVGTVLVQSYQSPLDNKFMLALAKANPFIKGIVGWIDLVAPDLDEQLSEWKDEPLIKGFRHVAQAEPNDFLGKPEIIRGIEALGLFGFTYDILIKPPQMHAALHLVKALPDQPFVIDHMAKPYIAAGTILDWKKEIGLLAECPNLSCKVSGMVTEADWKNWKRTDLRPYFEVVFNAFGPNRVMYGSDWPVCLVAADYDAVIETAEDFISTFSADEQKAFWYDNAVNFYSLG